MTHDTSVRNLELARVSGWVANLWSKTCPRLVLFLFFFLLYAVLLGSEGLESPNIGTRYLLARAIVEDNALTWTWPKELFWFFPDYGVLDGTFLSDKAPGLSFVMVPVYLLAKIITPLLGGSTGPVSAGLTDVDHLALAWLKLLTSAVAAFGLVRLVDLGQLLDLPHRLTVLSTIMVGFTTLYLVYAPTLFPSVLVGVLVVLVVYHLVRYDRQAYPSDLLMAGLVAGFGCVVEYSSVLLLPWFAWFVLSRLLWVGLPALRRTLVDLCLFGSAIFVGIAPLLLYNWALLGHPLTTTYQYSHWVTSIHFYYDLIAGLDVLLLRPSKGLFFFNPVLFLAFLGFFTGGLVRRHPRETTLLLASILTTVFFYAKNFDPTGGTAYGPRYIIPIIPLMVIGLGGWLVWIRRSPLGLNITLFTTLWSGLTSWIGVLGVGVFPEPPEEHPLFQLAWENVTTQSYHPTLLANSPPLFWGLLVVMVALVGWWAKDSIADLWHFTEQSGLLTSFDVWLGVDVLGGQNNFAPTRNLYLYLTLSMVLGWFYLVLFLLVGTTFLSSAFPGSRGSIVADLSVIVTWLVLTAGLTYQWFQKGGMSEKVEGSV